MRNWVRRQPFCAGLRASVRPKPRPEWMDGDDPDLIPLFVSWEMDKEFLLGPSAWGADAASAVVTRDAPAPTLLLARD